MPIGTLIALIIYLSIVIVMLVGIIAVTIDGVKRNDPGAGLIVLVLVLILMLVAGGGGALVSQLLYGG